MEEFIYIYYKKYKLVSIKLSLLNLLSSKSLYKDIIKIKTKAKLKNYFLTDSFSTNMFLKRVTFCEKAQTLLKLDISSLFIYFYYVYIHNYKKYKLLSMKLSSFNLF